MIIGKGSIAKVLTDRDDIVFFASGVSNSSCVDEKEYEREFNLLKTIPIDKHVVYFSNLGIYYKKDRYTQHKIDIEEYIRNHYLSYTIVRIEVCEWVKTPHTILNVFKSQLNQGIEPVIQDTTRYVLSLSEFLYWVNLIQPGVRNEMNILGRKLTIAQIVNEIKQGKI
jgi:UDP-2-acetamido-2,6-beta-L-arabino-hexul-4-ose reductase